MKENDRVTQASKILLPLESFPHCRFLTINRVKRIKEKGGVRLFYRDGEA